jgi:superfamily II DNA helicase RecQ
LPDPETIAVRAPARAKAAPAPPIDLSDADAPLFEQLKAWRLRAAAGKPAYTVAHNKTLIAIATARPADDASLGAIRGVGPSFVAKYGDEVLALVGSHAPAA